jgi:hypothetical protein
MSGSGFSGESGQASVGSVGHRQGNDRALFGFVIHLITNENLQKIPRRTIIDLSPPTPPRIGLCPLSPAGIFLSGVSMMAQGLLVGRATVAGNNVRLTVRAISEASSALMRNFFTLARKSGCSWRRSTLDIVKAGADVGSLSNRTTAIESLTRLDMYKKPSTLSVRRHG